MRKILNKAFVLLAAGLLFGACEKNTIPEITETVMDGAKVKFFFHVEEAPRTNFYLDNKKVTGVTPSADSVILGNLYGSAYPSNAYAVVPAGNYTLSAIDTMVARGTADLLASSQVNLQQDKHYSVYLAGTTESYETFILEDNLPEADFVSIWWRFVNTMAGMPFEVDVYAVRAAVPATETTPAEEVEVVELGKNLGFKEQGVYTRLRTGSYTFKVYESGTTYDPETTKPYISHTVTLASLGRVYTTHLRGTYAEKPATSKITFFRDR